VVLGKYNTSSEDRMSGKKLSQKFKFSNGEMRDLSDIRLELSTYTSEKLIGLNLLSLKS